MSEEQPPPDTVPRPAGLVPKASTDSSKEKPNVAGNGDRRPGRDGGQTRGPQAHGEGTRWADRGCVENAPCFPVHSPPALGSQQVLQSPG